MIVQQTQDPSAMLPTDDYKLLMCSIKQGNPASKIYGGHYSRMGLRWDLPVSASMGGKVIFMRPCIFH